MPATEPKKLPGIFISYRRSDTPDAVGRIYDRLIAEFGKARVFKDVDSIPLGQDFRSHLNDIVGGCAAVLAIIGPRWVDTRNAAGQRRLEDPDDFVRIELEAALARSVPVVPVLVGHAPMPGISELPTTLASMAFRQSIEVRPDPDFHHDATRLVSALRQILDPGAVEIEPVAATTRTQGSSAKTLAWSIAALAGVAAVALALPAFKHLQETPPLELRTDIATPATDQPFDFALSPDGRQLVFVATGDGVSRLWLRSLASATAQPLPGTEGGTGPFWSPDSRSIAFFSRGQLKRLDIGAGQPQTLTSGSSVGSGTWNADGVILYARGPVDPLYRIAASGGAITVVTKSNAQSSAHRAPQFLPDGRHYLFTAFAGTNVGIYLGSLDGGVPVKLNADVSTALYLPSGWMLWMRSGTLQAQRLDVEKAVLVGEPRTLADSVGAVTASPNGLIAYRSGSTRRLQLQWRDRAGALLGSVGDPDATILAPRVSPDGQRVALSRFSTQSNRDIWLLDGARGSRVTFDPSVDGYPAWTPDGSRIAFMSFRSNGGDLYQKASNGAGAEELLVTSNQVKFPSGWSADGRFLLYFSLDPVTGTDLWVMPTTGNRKPFIFLKTQFGEVWSQFSPDGRWVAYQSDESGRDEIYVRPFNESGANQSGGQWQVSASGGVHPVWQADGNALFYINPEGAMMSAPIKVNGSAVVPGTPSLLFASHIAGGGIDRTQGRQYDVSSDGRFLINTELEAGIAPPITLIQNWNPDAGK